MQYWISNHQWVISGSLVTLQLSAIVVVESMVVDGMISGLTSLILGFSIRVCIAVYMIAAWRCVSEAR